jgi:hypothetical protein
MELKYILYPLLLEKEPTTIYCAGGKGKSVFADLIALLVSRGSNKGSSNDNPLDFTANRANRVLYLDWEADPETHRRYITAIRKGLNWNGTSPNQIMYKKLEHPLSQVIDSIRHTVKNKNIGLVIIDSQMAATASGTRGLTEAQIASEYYNNLRSLECATLTIDHITKQGMTSENGVEAPYGSVVKFNRSRSQFELRLDESMDDQDKKDYVLIHRKFNLGRKQKPIGYRLEFQNNEHDDMTLERILFSRCEANENLVHPKKENERDKVIKLLDDKGPMSRQDIRTAINITSDNLRVLLSRKTKKGYFVETDGLVSYEESE